MTSSALNDAIIALRKAGLAPTQVRVTVCALALSGPKVALNPEELCERAMDDGLCLTQEAAGQVLNELRSAGILPRDFAHYPHLRDWDAEVRRIKVLANPHRLRLLRELVVGERCAGDLGRLVGLKPSALSQHLARLQADGLVNRRRQASHIFYSLNDNGLHEMRRVLAS